MSRIGKQPIELPEGVEVKIEGRHAIIKGPKGELTREIPEEISVACENSKLVVSPKRKSFGSAQGRLKNTSAMWGLTRALLANCVRGVTEGFEKKLELVGVGYKASIEKDKTLKIEVGYSHPVNIDIPEGISVLVEKNIITISGIDKQKVGEFAAKIRANRPPEPYKGKGIRYEGEKIRRKEGKKATSTAS